MDSRETSGQPWAKRPDETGRQYDALLRYLDMGESRSMVAVAKASGFSRQHVERLAVRFQWVFRADQWDAHVATEKVSVREAAVKAQAQKEAEAISTMVDIALEFMRRLHKQVMESKDLVPGITSAREFLSDAVRLSRLQRGLEATPEEREREMSDAIKQLSELVNRRKKRAALKPSEQP